MRVLILGAGPAGLTVAEHIRALETAANRDPASIVMVSSEPFPPYSPPAMADHFLTGREEALFWKGEDVCDRLGVRYHSGVAARTLEPERSCVVLEDGTVLDYDRLVIATGSRLYAPVPGYDLPGVYNFKSLTAARSLVDRARHGEVGSALIVGAGFIGVEVALLLSDLGLAVTMIQRRWVMPRMLDPETAGVVLDTLQARGVTVHLHTTASAFVGRDRVEGVGIESGEQRQADVYIAATGVKPNVDWLSGSQLDVGWGIRVDDGLRTNLPNIYAVGDVAETRDRMTGDRYVHAIFPNAVEQGRVVASQLLGYEAEYQGAEAMNSLRHLGVPLIAVGAQKGSQEVRFRQGDILRKLFLADGRIVGFRLAGDVRGAGFYRALMLKRMDVGRFSDRLLDPRFGFGTVALGSTQPMA